MARFAKIDTTGIETVIVSRCDRLGDLVLSLPVLGLLRDAGFSRRVLHCSPYARAIGQWALHNGLATEVWCAGESAPEGLGSDPRSDGCAGLALFHSKESALAFRALALRVSLGPRSKLGTIMAYRKTVAQHRSRVEKSEMEYNLDLGRALLRSLGRAIPEFRGLPALRVPPEWSAPQASPDLVLVVSNRGSAGNWPIERYIAWGMRERAKGRSVDFLVSGVDADERRRALEGSGVLTRGCRVQGDFADLSQLIAYLAGAKEVVSSSTGPLHIAHAAGVPVVGVYPVKRVESFDRWQPAGYWHAAPIRYYEIRD